MIRILTGMALIVSLHSCRKSIQVDPPTDYLVASTVFTTDQSALSALSGLYSQMMQSNLLFANNAITIYAGLSSDELRNYSSASYDEFAENSLVAPNGTLQNNFWAAAYKYIYQANSILEGLARSTGVSAVQKKQIGGEALFARAYCYFYLVNLFGEVPYILSTDHRVNSLLPRTPVQQVYAGIVADLIEAADNMQVVYPSAGRVRPNTFAAKALLARVYLYQQNYSAAELISTEIIQSGLYSLVGNLNSVFLASSNEAIWQMSPVLPNYNTWDGNIFVTNPGLVPSFACSNSLLNSFEPGDQRKASWVKLQTVGSTGYHFPFKYKVKTGTSVTENQVNLRLAEQFLIRAEARIHQGNIPGALNDLNLVRSRAGLANASASTITAIKIAIEQERRIELFAEWGHRWLDLKRGGTIDSVLNAAKPGLWQPTDALYPIPALEIQRNPSLTQNPGY